MLMQPLTSSHLRCEPTFACRGHESFARMIGIFAVVAVALHAPAVPRAVQPRAPAVPRAVQPRAPPPSMSAETATDCSALLRSLFDGAVDADAVASRCSASVEWDDLAAAAPAIGPDAVRELMAAKYPPGSLIVIDRCSDGRRSGGFTWHREEATIDGSPSEPGLRGTLFAALDDDGLIAYVREACEPILKPGEATEALLKAVTQNMEAAEPKPPPTYTQQTPTTASELASYLWRDAYPGGASPAEALRLFADDIVYEDFNYPEPFVGKAQVSVRARVRAACTVCLVTTPSPLGGHRRAALHASPPPHALAGERLRQRLRHPGRGLRAAAHLGGRARVRVHLEGARQRQRGPAGPLVLRAQRRGQGGLHARLTPNPDPSPGPDPSP